MERFKKMRSKIIASFMAMVLMFSLVSLPVHAAENYGFEDLTGKMLYEGDVISTTGTWYIRYNDGVIAFSDFPNRGNTFSNGLTSSVTVDSYNTRESSSSMFKYPEGKSESDFLGWIVAEDNVAGQTRDLIKLKAVWKSNVTGVTLNKETATLKVGNKEQLTATIAPTDATNKNVTWTSSDDTVATVSTTGEITALKAGTATITVTTEDGSKSATCVVTVEAQEKPSPTITSGAGSTYQISNGKDMSLTCSGKLEDLTGIYVDGKLLAENNYTTASGSTILTLKASYLDTLSAGTHTLKFQYKNNISAETTFTITSKTEPNKPETPKSDSVIKETGSPQTGDTSITILYFSLIVLSGCTVLFVSRRNKTLKQ